MLADMAEDEDRRTSPDDPPEPDLTPVELVQAQDRMADERWPVTSEAMIDAALKGESAPSLYEGSHYDLDAGQGCGYDGRYDRQFLARLASSAKAEHWRPKSAEHVAKQREHKKARAKRKAKKGWA